MSLYQTVYFMSLVGGLAGLIAWAANALLSPAFPAAAEAWLPDLAASSTLGALIGGLHVYFSDKWAGARIQSRWIVSGVLIGLLAGVCAGLAGILIEKRISPQYPAFARVLVWMLTGCSIGLGLGLRWVSVNPIRVVHALTGGLVGGAVGGSIFAGLGTQVPDLSQAVGFVLVGVGICFGITFAPILLREGLLQFISSGDPRAQNKFGRRRKQWEIQQGDHYIVGSRSQDVSKTSYRPDVQVFIPDAAIAPRHAVVYAQNGRFHLARHPDTGGEAGLARYVLRVRGKSVVRAQELRDSDDILIGRTALRFQAIKREQ